MFHSVRFRLLRADPSRHWRSSASGRRRQRKTDLQLWDGGRHLVLGQVVQGWPGVLQIRPKRSAKASSLPAKRNPRWCKSKFKKGSLSTRSRSRKEILVLIYATLNSDWTFKFSTNQSTQIERSIIFTLGIVFTGYSPDLLLRAYVANCIANLS